MVGGWKRGWEGERDSGRGGRKEGGREEGGKEGEREEGGKEGERRERDEGERVGGYSW